MATENLGEAKTVGQRMATGQAQLKFARVAGAAADTNITVTGISPYDVVVAAFSLATGAASGSGVDDLVDELKITAEDTIQFDTTATTGLEVLLIFWHFAGGPR